MHAIHAKFYTIVLTSYCGVKVLGLIYKLSSLQATLPFPCPRPGRTESQQRPKVGEREGKRQRRRKDFACAVQFPWNVSISVGPDACPFVAAFNSTKPLQLSLLFPAVHTYRRDTEQRSYYFSLLVMD